MTDARRDTALREASVPTLLMCLAQITRDPRWLEEPFLPKRDISIFAEPTGGLSPQAQQVVRDAVARVLDGMHEVTGDPRYRPSLWLRRRARLGLSLLHEEP
jgi:hypothetical protein